MQANQQPIETTLYSLSDRLPDPSDRRGDDRFLTLFRVGALLIDGRRELCLLKNISAGGMLIRAYCTIAQGTSLAVELKRGEMISGTVSWVSDGNLGIAFDQPVDIIALLTPGPDTLRPRLPRVEVSGYATLRQGANVVSMRTCDVSQGGIKVAGDRPLTVGDDVVVTLPRLAARQGVVIWSDGGQHGVTFNRLLALAELVAWLREQREEMRAAG